MRKLTVEIDKLPLTVIAPDSSVLPFELSDIQNHVNVLHDLTLNTRKLHVLNTNVLVYTSVGYSDPGGIYGGMYRPMICHEQSILGNVLEGAGSSDGSREMLEQYLSHTPHVAWVEDDSFFAALLVSVISEEPGFYHPACYTYFTWAIVRIFI